MKLFQIPKFSALQYFLNAEVKGSLLILRRFNQSVCLSYEDIFDLQFHSDVH